MEQKTRRDAESCPKPELKVITKSEFFKEITLDIYDGFALVFFILNTLHFLQGSDRWYCYCEEKKIFLE